MFARISKLFAGMICQKKLIAQAKKIMREWKRAEDFFQKKKGSLAAKLDDMHEKLPVKTR